MEFDAEFKFAKIQNSHLCGGREGFAEFDAEFKFAKIQNSHWLSSNLLKSKIPICVCVFGGGFTEFDAEFKFDKIQNSHL